MVDEMERARDIIDQSDPLFEEPPPDDRNRDRHQRIGNEDDGAISVATANVRADEQREAERDPDPDRRAGDEEQGVPE
ncbi:MAG: hypothetical protein E6H67_00015 [Betaproteobacteria bacterium]|nr:MAG: hypothetical protein E6H67_00015 [Betaproteobacteria bacterium]